MAALEEDPNSDIRFAPGPHGYTFVYLNGVDISLQCQIMDLDQVCDHCKTLPCCLEDHGKQIEDAGDEMAAVGEQPGRIRFMLYHLATQLIHGPNLGRGNRRPLPECVEAHIKAKYPNTDGKAYVGFKENEDTTAEGEIEEM